MSNAVEKKVKKDYQIKKANQRHLELNVVRQSSQGPLLHGLDP